MISSRSAISSSNRSHRSRYASPIPMPSHCLTVEAASLFQNRRRGVSRGLGDRHPRLRSLAGLANHVPTPGTNTERARFRHTSVAARSRHPRIRATHSTLDATDLHRCDQGKRAACTPPNVELLVMRRSRVRFSLWALTRCFTPAKVMHATRTATHSRKQ